MLYRVFVLMIVAAVSGDTMAHAQNSTISIDNRQAAVDSARSVHINGLEKLAWIGAAGLVYAGVDYVGFNATKENRTALIGYRIFQGLMHAALTWFLVEKVGLPSAISFNLIWWTFGLDFLYYGYAELTNPGHPWDSRGDLNRGVLSNKCTWAYWTPVGIIRGMRRNDPIAGNTLAAQSCIGLSLAIAITLAY